MVQKNKYNAKKVEVDGIVFSSKAESFYYEHLLELMHDGVVESFEMQKAYTLLDKFPHPKTGKTIRAIQESTGASIDLGAISKIWRAGCIIRAQFLNRIADAYAAEPNLEVLLTAPYFVDALGRAQDAWRHIVGTAATAGIPAPAFSSSLAYYDGLRAKRLPAALIQAQRDFFGAHTYQRIDKPGTFHTLWSGDRTEVEAEDTH